MSQVLYRKYRPKTFAQVEGQEHVVQTLQGAILSGRFGQAYLFAGPRGSGKTTMARLLAKAVNCQNLEAGSRKLEARSQKLEAGLAEPCNICSSCSEINENRSLDIIEIDAASNRGIDEIRNLKDSARVSASSSNYKVFIIDEVHMLTPPAFNALLKILEEPPEHVVFILATTEPHKLPETILSRVQRFDFQKLSQPLIIGKLEKIAGRENLKIEPAALEALATSAEGSMRDAESALAKLIAYAGANISLRQAIEILGVVPPQEHAKFLSAIAAGDKPAAMAQISRLYALGINLENFTGQFVKYLRSVLLDLISQPVAAGQTPQFTPQFLVKAISRFIKAKEDFRDSPVPQLPLELAVIELADGD